MSCCHPFKAFDTGLLTENGKKDLVLCFHGAPNMISTDRVKKRIDFSKAPHTFVAGHAFLTDPIEVPCGSCVGCRMARAKDWKIRNCLELACHKEAYFVTLTYDDAHLPINESGEPYVRKRDFQLFLKRLRKRFGSLRYFGCLEYGELNGRPHGHFLLYMPMRDFRLIGVNKFTSDMIAAVWPFGHHLVEAVTPGSIAYVSGYVEKKQKDPNYPNYPVKPCLMMSRKPGIGMLWFVKHYDEIKATQKVYGQFSEGSNYLTSSLPKSFKRNLEGIPWFEEFKEICKENAKDFEKVLMCVYRAKNKEDLGFLMENAMNSRLSKLRKVSL